jgi:hypothetical protein
MEYTFETKFEYGDEVYHCTPDGDKGIVVDVSYNTRSNSVKYLVAFGRRNEDQVWCDEIELSTDKIF